eukprot:TRINITY_DN4742_c0_g1_i1.p1 TRINITY_DN4742_c0_g1~~TRINITY_DN4742_c0_g1_i1.p1  ORF type:complete len:351 (+),score=81.32 TRINITY_DN4742_c0_g1_i1:94-1053(+)
MEIKHFDENKTTFYDIVFSITELDEKITIKRRYNDFDSIQLKLMEVLKNFPLPSIPPKDYGIWSSISYLIGNSNEEELKIENRKWGFKRWFGKMLSHPKLKNSPNFREFISSERYPQDPKLNKGWSFYKVTDFIPFMKTSMSQLDNIEKMIRQLSNISDLFCQSKVNVLKDFPHLEKIDEFVKKEKILEGTHLDSLSSFFHQKSTLFRDHGKKIWTDYILTLKYILLDIDYIKGKSVEEEELTWFRESIEKELKDVLLRLIKYSFNYHLSCSLHIKDLLDGMGGEEVNDDRNDGDKIVGRDDDKVDNDQDEDFSFGRNI